MAEIAAVTGRHREAEEYEEVADEVESAFRKSYIGPTGQVESGTQTAYVLALHMGLMPDDLRANAAGYLVDAIAQRIGT